MTFVNMSVALRLTCPVTDLVATLYHFIVPSLQYEHRKEDQRQTDGKYT